jgi:hypothetical protein
LEEHESPKLKAAGSNPVSPATSKRECREWFKNLNADDKIGVEKLAEKLYMQIAFMENPELYARNLLDSTLTGSFHPEELILFLRRRDSIKKIIKVLIEAIYTYIATTPEEVEEKEEHKADVI